MSDTTTSPATFEEIRDAAAEDCEAVAAMLTDLAAQVRAGDLDAFRAFWLEGGTEEGDPKIAELRERLVLRHFVMMEGREF